jgi:hypothetical protein
MDYRLKSRRMGSTEPGICGLKFFSFLKKVLDKSEIVCYNKGTKTKQKGTENYVYYRHQLAL